MQLYFVIKPLFRYREFSLEKKNIVQSFIFNFFEKEKQTITELEKLSISSKEEARWIKSLSE